MEYALSWYDLEYKITLTVQPIDIKKVDLSN